VSFHKILESYLLVPVLVSNLLKFMFRFAPRKALTLLRGNPLFFSYTTSDTKNATIVAHCQKEVFDEETKTTVTEKAVYMLSREDTAGVNDFNWKKISISDPKIRWPTPICHSAGGGDNVLVVEDGQLHDNNDIITFYCNDYSSRHSFKPCR